MSDITDHIPHVECDVCHINVYVDNNRTKRHPRCQMYFNGFYSKHLNRARRRAAVDGRFPSDEDNRRARISAQIEAERRAQNDDAVFLAAKTLEREAITREWEIAKRMNAEEDEPVPEDILAYDYFGTLPDDIVPDDVSNRDADPVEAAGAPKDKQVKHSLTNADIDRALNND